jgi:glucokinase
MPAKGAEIKLTNSSWRFVKEELRQQFRFERFVVINDFEALAASVPVLKGPQLAELRPGNPDPTSVSLVIGPGTGLGVGAYVPASRSAWASDLRRGAAMSASRRTPSRRSACGSACARNTAGSRPSAC